MDRDELDELDRMSEEEYQRDRKRSRWAVGIVATVIVLTLLLNWLTADDKKPREIDAQAVKEQVRLDLDSDTDKDRKPSSCNTATVAIDRAVARISAGDKSDFDSFSTAVERASEDLLSAHANVRDPEVRGTFEDIQGALIGMKVAIELSGDSEASIQFAKDTIEQETKELDRQVVAFRELCKA